MMIVRREVLFYRTEDRKRREEGICSALLLLLHGERGTQSPPACTY